MGAYFAKQPNGLYCRFSTVVDTITHWNMSENDVIEYFAEKAREDARRILKDGIHEFEDIKKDFVPGNDSIEEYDELIKLMGDKDGLGAERIEEWKQWEKDMEEEYGPEKENEQF